MILLTRSLMAALTPQALDEATALIGATRRRSGMICMAVNAGQMLEDVKAAAEFLSSARERFCESVTTGKVFGEYAAEGITQLRAVQRGEMAEGGSILLCSGRQRGQGECACACVAGCPIRFDMDDIDDTVLYFGVSAAYLLMEC